MASNERGLSGINFVNASVKRRFVVNVNASAFVVCADYALADNIVDLPSGCDKHVTVDASKVRVNLCFSNG